MWRVRNVLQLFLIFFLWDTVFSSSNTVLFGYDRTKILTYVFGLLIVRAIVLSSRSVDIAGEISQGLLTNYLLKPLSYFKYWFTRDMASKALNLIFASFEIVLLYFLLKPQFFLQTNPIFLSLFIISIILAIILFFLLLTLFNLFPLWYPEQAWGPTFFLMIFMDFIGGGVFPLDILPSSIQQVLYLTPFPYLMFIPIQIYLEKFSVVFALKSLLIAMAWILILLYLVNTAWRVGLRLYRAEGR
jgi:ABC-2 type transport system permease protein